MSSDGESLWCAATAPALVAVDCSTQSCPARKKRPSSISCYRTDSEPYVCRNRFGARTGSGSVLVEPVLLVSYLVERSRSAEYEVDAALDVALVEVMGPALVQQRVLRPDHPNSVQHHLVAGQPQRHRLHSEPSRHRHNRVLPTRTLVSPNGLLETFQ